MPKLASIFSQSSSIQAHPFRSKYAVPDSLSSISLSIGNPPTAAVQSELARLIRENTIILATTGNSGNNGLIPFPACEPKVLKIFATEPPGYKASISVPQGTTHDDKQFSFVTLGYGIAATALMSLDSSRNVPIFDRPDDKDAEKFPGRWAVMNGTSLATPIAAAMVAVI